MRHIKIWDLTWVTGRKRESHPLAPIVAAPARFLTHAASPIKLFTTWQVAKRGDVVCSWLAIHEGVGTEFGPYRAVSTFV